MTRSLGWPRRLLALLLLVVTTGSVVAVPMLDRDIHSGEVAIAERHDPSSCREFHHSHLLCVQQQHSGWKPADLPVAPIAASPVSRRPARRSWDRPRTASLFAPTLPRAPPLS